jgi:hypothetical protein
MVINKSDFFAFDKFIERVQKNEALEIKVAENFDEFAGSSVADEELEKVTDTNDLLSTYVDATDTDLNKDTIKSKLRELYVEAQNTEIV